MRHHETRRYMACTAETNLVPSTILQARCKLEFLLFELHPSLRTFDISPAVRRVQWQHEETWRS